MGRSCRTTGKTPSNANPNLQDAINNLCPPPPPQRYHDQPQHSLHGDPTTPQDHMQVDVVTPTPSSVVPPSSLMDPTPSTTYHVMQVESCGAGPSSSIHLDSTVVGGASTIQEHMQENIGQALPRRRKTGWMSSNVSIGQDQAFNKVCDFLRDDNVGMVGIYGMGGVGKTTLLKKVCKEFLEPSHFKIIWIVVSKSINVDSIQKNIMEEVNLHFNKKELRHKRAEKINKALAKNKVALLFDDIWQSLNLEELGIIGDNDILDTSNFKIIFTTRSKKVCTEMKPDEDIKVECLGWDDSWAIFEKCVGKKALEKCDPRVLSLAKKVAKECDGLPLALTVIGRAMICKYTHQEWEDALNMLQKSRCDVLDSEKHLFTCLKLSYDYLPDYGEKKCFLYCCLFPEDYEMTSSNLVELWAVEGLLDMNGSFIQLLNRGYAIIGTLRAACLLERGRSNLKVKMHDVIRDMGLWILSDQLKLNYFVMTNKENIDRWEEAHKVFVWAIDKLPEKPLCDNLTTLLIMGKQFNEITIPKGFFKSMCKVRVLQLCSVYFLDRHITIRDLVELRYLSLIYTKFSSLLIEMGYLSKLKVLECCSSSSDWIQLQLRGTMEQLRKLVLCPCPNEIVAELEHLPNLEMMTIGFYSSGEFIPRLPHSLRRVDLLYTFEKSHQMLSALQDLPDLSSLRVASFDDVWEFSVLSSSHFSSLEDLSFAHCWTVQEVKLGQPRLQNLRVLHFIQCESLKSIFGLEHLPGLAELTVYVCPMEELIKADVDIRFPNLKVMNLVYLENLKSICSDTVLFPSLTSFFLVQCNGLKKLPLGLRKGKLKGCEIRGSREWWDGLSWEDDGFKTFIITKLCLELRPFWKIYPPPGYLQPRYLLFPSTDWMDHLYHFREGIIEWLKDGLYDEIPTTYHHKDCFCSHQSSPCLQLQI